MKIKKTSFLLLFIIIISGFSLLFLENDVKNTNLKNPILPNLSSLESEWYRTWGGSGIDNCSGIVVDTSDNLYLVGSTASYGNGGFDICLVKYNNSGSYLWNRTWGGIENDYGHATLLDSLGNIYIVGHTESFGSGGVDMCLLKFNSTGSLLWNRTWGGSNDDHAFSIAIDMTSNIYLAGDTYIGRGGRVYDYDIALVKYNASGDYKWNYTWGDDRKDTAYGIAVDSLNDIYLTGVSKNFPSLYSNGDMSLIKYSDGGSGWHITWNGSFKDVGYAIDFDSLGNIFFVGTADCPQGGICGPNNTVFPSAIINKYDKSGNFIRNNILWYQYAGYHAFTIDQTNNMYIAGFTNQSGDIDMLMVMYNNNTNFWLQFNKTWGGQGYDIANGIALDSSGSLYVVGTTESYGAGSSDMVLVKLIFIKSIPSQPQPFISGYNLLVLLGVLFAIVIIIKKKMEKSQK